MTRFGKSTDDDVVKILSDKDAGNTKKATKCAMQSLTAYIMESGRDVNLNDCNPTVLAGLLASFYMDARKKDSSQYKLSALKAIRFGLSGCFIAELDIEIIKYAEFHKANEIFQAVSVDLKRKGLGKIDHTQPIDGSRKITLARETILDVSRHRGS